MGVCLSVCQPPLRTSLANAGISQGKKRQRDRQTERDTHYEYSVDARPRGTAEAACC